MDRIDIHVDVPQVDYEKRADDRLGEPSARTHSALRAQSGERVERAVQRARLQNTPFTTNADTPALAPERSADASVGPAVQEPGARH